MDWPVRVVRLASGPGERGLWCSPEGLSLAGHPLLQKKQDCLQPKAMTELQAVLDDAYGATPQLDARRYLPGLNGIAKSLNQGDLALAMIGSLLLKLPDVPEANTRKYPDEQARDSNGRWTQGAEGDARQSPPADVEPKEAPSLAPVEAEIAGEAEGSLIAGLAPRVLGLLGELAGAIAFPVAVLAGVLIPTNRSNIHYGDLPGFPELSYRSDEGMATIFRRTAAGNFEPVYEGGPGKNGFYYDADGHVIGRQVGTGILFDHDALVELAAKPPASLEIGANPAFDPDGAPKTDGDEPRVCPPRTKEDITGRSDRALAYQNQITGLPAGWDVLYNGVRYDGCDQVTQRMQEAKGLMGGYLPRLSDEDLKEDDFYEDIMDQASRQNNAAADRGVDWYFADERFADFFTNEFAKAGYLNIVVHYREAIMKKFDDCIALVKNHLSIWQKIHEQTFALRRSSAHMEAGEL